MCIPLRVPGALATPALAMLRRAGRRRCADAPVLALSACVWLLVASSSCASAQAPGGGGGGGPGGPGATPNAHWVPHTSVHIAIGAIAGASAVLLLLTAVTFWRSHARTIDACMRRSMAH